MLIENCRLSTLAGKRTYNKRIFVFSFRCKCPDETYKCVPTGENVSMRAYVYHCRQNTTVDFDGESPYDMDSTDYVS